MREALAELARDAREALAAEIQPRDRFEHAVVAALGEISWDEAMAGIRAHRGGTCTCWDCKGRSESANAK